MYFNEEKPFEGADFFADKFNFYIAKLKSYYKRKKYKTLAQTIYENSKKLQIKDIPRKLYEIKKDMILKKNKSNIVELLSILVELLFQKTNKRAFPTQIMGALSLIDGYMIEMKTGEGKTLTAALAATVLAYQGKKVHIFTANDYLAKRDATNLNEFYQSAYLKCGYIIEDTLVEKRKEVYKSNIVYSTSKNILADFLKDKIKTESFTINELLLKKINGKDLDLIYEGLDVAIIDEADSVLADDALTPLIISAKVENELLKKNIVIAQNIAKNFLINKDYIINHKEHKIKLTKNGLKKAQKSLNLFSKEYQNLLLASFLIKQILVAKELFEKNKHYIIKDNKIKIVDESTGRILKDRSWSEGLQQAIELKENVPLSEPTKTFAKMSFQRFFRIYNHLCGMSGTLTNLDNEFWYIYKKIIMSIPRYKKSKLFIEKEKIFLNHKQRDDFLIDYIEKLHKKAIPILIGTNSIKESEKLTKKLKKRGLFFYLLNAKNDEKEADIIKKAGKKGAITISTNMAGRGTDILIDEEIEKLGGLFVIVLGKNKSKRIDLQFFGRAGRMGQCGRAVMFLSLEDFLIKENLSKLIYYFYKKFFNYSFIKYLSIFTYNILQKKVDNSLSNIRKKYILEDFKKDENISLIFKV